MVMRKFVTLKKTLVKLEVGKESWTDPNLLKTLDLYDKTGDFLRQLEMDDDPLTKAIIGTIGDVDSYQLPDAKGYSSLVRHLLGITEEERQRRREEILSTSLKDFKEFAEVIDAAKEKGVSVVVASADDVAKADDVAARLFPVLQVENEEESLIAINNECTVSVVN